MPQINTVLADLSRDDLIKLLVQRDFGHIAAYYEQASEIQVQHQTTYGSRPDNGFAKRPESSYAQRSGGQTRFPAKSEDEGMTYVRINVGKRNGLTPSLLMSLINRATNGPMLRLGRIRIFDNDALFGIEEAGAHKIMPRLNKSLFNDRPVKAVFDRKLPTEKPVYRPPYSK